MKVLVINSGSSSIKYQLFVMPEGEVMAGGAVERIGEADAVHRHLDGNGDETSTVTRVSDHREGLQRIGTLLNQSRALSDLSELSAIAHRVVHGGEAFRRPARIDDEVITRIRQMIPLAPLHNPPNLTGIEVAMQQAPEVPQVAVFDTAFHQSIPAHAYRYALPEALYTQYQVRRFGFHGTSHYYVAKQAATFLGKPLDALNLITLHLGNGASATAVRQGQSVDTSMGMTPLEGLIMGTRCGDIDPAIHFYLGREAALEGAQLERVLNKESGMKGVCGDHDMRGVHRLADAGDARAQLALDMYCYRIKKYIGAYSAALGKVDAVIFTGGVGENDSWVRLQVISEMDNLGLVMDEDKNRRQTSAPFAVHREESRIAILVIPTNEELEIALQAVDCLQPEE
jgi:acetate kinase